MTIGCTEFFLSVPVSVARKWRSCWGKAVARFNTGFGGSNRVDSPGCRRDSEQGVRLRWMKKPWKKSERTCGAPLAIGGMLRTCGTESFSAIIWPSDIAFDWVFGNANGCFASWDFDAVNRDRSLPRLTLKPSGHIKKLRRLAAREDIDLWCEDECHFQQHGSRCTMWIPPEDCDPILEHAPTRKSVALFGAVRVGDGRLVTQQEKTFDASSFQAFLKQLLRHLRNGRKIVVVLDNARYHHAKILQPWLWEHRSVLTLDFLPPYSPDLNPVERVCKMTRRLCTHNRYFATLEEVTQVLNDQFLLWRKPNSDLQRLCAII